MNASVKPSTKIESQGAWNQNPAVATEDLFHAAITEVINTPAILAFPYPENLEWIREILLKPNVKKEIDDAVKAMAATFIYRMKRFLDPNRKTWAKPQAVKSIHKIHYINIQSEDMSTMLACIYKDGNRHSDDIGSDIVDALVSLYPTLRDLEFYRYSFTVRWKKSENSGYLGVLDRGKDGDFGFFKNSQDEESDFIKSTPISIEIMLSLYKTITDKDREYATQQINKGLIITSTPDTLILLDKKNNTEIAIKDIRMSARLYHALACEKLWNLWDILNMGEYKIGKIPNLGKKSMLELKAILNEYWLILKQ